MFVEGACAKTIFAFVQPLDVNAHVNNARYADWLTDALGTSVMRQYCLKTLNINYAAEVLPDKDAPWLVYCRTGRRSADAVQKLDALGYTNIYDLGGILSWPYEIEGDFEGHF